MAQINTCLKRTFTLFNVFFAIVGGVIIGLGMVSQILSSSEGGGNLSGRTTGLISVYVLGAVVMVIASVGAHGARKEHKVSLIVFLVCMVIGGLIMFRAGFTTAIIRPQLRFQMEKKFQEAVPLDEAPYEVQQVANDLQEQLHCCGLFSYSDWEDHPPPSCRCEPSEEPDQCQVVSYESLIPQKQSVYKQPCFPIIMSYVHMGFDIVLGVIFTLAALAVIGLILSSIMIHQLRHPNRTMMVLSVPATFSSGPPKYEELGKSYPPPPY
ncbi:tetraspanin-8-like [Menidia menidia]